MAPSRCWAGWNCPLDDAPALVVTGFNEGNVPASLNSDLFLPNQLRRGLDIEDNDRRYARDAYALSVLAASREDLRLIVGRRSADGDPLLPSRLLFACDDPAMARRVMAFFSAEDRPKNDLLVGVTPVPIDGTQTANVTPSSIIIGRLQPGQEQSRLEVPRPKPLSAPITSMRVTEFKDYLGCPYRYYLRHVLKLEGLDDSAEELDGAMFGSLAHEVLSRLGKDPGVAAGNAEAIASYLDAQLDAAVLAHFGQAPLPSILVQVEQLRRRLAALARWQAAWAAQGWRIEHVEVSPPAGKASLLVDGRPMFLRGRIDRIDVQESSGKRMIFDYKTSDGGQVAAQRRIARKAASGSICNCPCTGTSSRTWGSPAPSNWPTSTFPRTSPPWGTWPADWTEDDFADADRAAADVIRRVQGQGVLAARQSPARFFRGVCGHLPGRSIRRRCGNCSTKKRKDGGNP